ncbi:hypothetical protein GF325_13025, partial [Candidatus Bathyarchaeota archaeon]|nr:hypothetical protein [Candidatus Bathyarchaeota archaeon]
MKARSKNAIGWFTLCTILASLTASKIIHDDRKISSEFNDTTLLPSYPNGGLVWNETWGTEYDDACEDVWLDPTSTYAYTCGWTVNTSGPYNDDACLVKWHASNGTVAWNRTWGGTADDLAHGIWGNETHVFTVGRTESYGAQGTDISIIAWDAITGMIEWNVTWSSSSLDIGYAITGDANSNLYACGQTQGMLSDIIVLKFDSSGNEVWNYTLGLSGNDVAHAIWVDDAGSLIFCCGETDSIGAGSKDMILVRVQSTGSLFNYNTW